MNYQSAPAFRSAGYANIRTNASHVGGLVRQHGNVSFSRVFEAGHSVHWYQPETVYQIFRRAIFGHDIATGNVVIEAKSDYSSKGPANIRDIKNVAPQSPESICWLYQAGNSCTPQQKLALANGTAVVKDYVVVWPPSGNAPSSSTTTSGPNSNGAPGKRFFSKLSLVKYLMLAFFIVL